MGKALARIGQITITALVLSPGAVSAATASGSVVETSSGQNHSQWLRAHIHGHTGAKNAEKEFYIHENHRNFKSIRELYLRALAQTTDFKACCDRAYQVIDLHLRHPHYVHFDGRTRLIETVSLIWPKAGVRGQPWPVDLVLNGRYQLTSEPNNESLGALAEWAERRGYSASRIPKNRVTKAIGHTAEDVQRRIQEVLKRIKKRSVWPIFTEKD